MTPGALPQPPDAGAGPDTGRRAAVRAFLRQHAWRLIYGAAAAAFVLGFWGYRHIDGEDIGVADALYRSLQLFVLESDPDLPENTALQIARVLAPLSVAAAAARAVYALFRAQLENVGLRRTKDHVVVVGLGRRGRYLAERFGGGAGRVVAIEQDPGNPAIASCRLGGGRVLVGDATEVRMLRRARADQARVLVALSSDDETNVEVAVKADRLARGAGDDRRWFVHIANEHLWDELRERSVRGGDGPERRIQFFNIFERGAVAMLRDLPTDAGGRPPHIVVVGLDRMGVALVTTAARLVEVGSATATRPRLTVVDREASGRLEALLARHPQVAERFDVRLIETDLGEATLDARAILPDPADDACTRIYVTIDDESAGLTAALTLRRSLGPRPVPIVVQVAMRADSVARFLESDGDRRFIEVFGLVEETCTPELLTEHLTEAVAAALHHRYLHHRLAEGVAPGATPYMHGWDQLDAGRKAETIALARAVPGHLESHGYGIRLLGDRDRLVAFGDGELESLSRREHERWTLRQAELGRTDDDMVPWEALPESSREKDRVLMRALPEVLARAGFHVHRDGASPGA